MRYCIALFVALGIIFPTFAAAQENADGFSKPFGTAAMSASPITSPPLEMTSHLVRDTSHTPVLFTTLTAMYIGVNALDVVTTEQALGSGRGREANPAMALVAGNPYLFGLTKAAMTASTIVVMRRLHRTHPVAAIAFLIGANVGLGVVVAHNAAVAAPYR